MHFDPSEVQISTLLSIKTGGCPEDCAYCPQSAKYDTGVKAEKLMRLDAVAGRGERSESLRREPFSAWGAAWRETEGPRRRKTSAPWSRAVKALGLETCATLGHADARAQGAQAQAQAALGLLPTTTSTPSPEFYGEIITTRTYKDRLDTLDAVREAGINVCCGGIVGMGRGRQTTAAGMVAGAGKPAGASGKACRSNMLVQVEGTPLGRLWQVRSAGVRAHDCCGAQSRCRNRLVRLSAGREDMSEETQALCFLAGANSIFYGAETSHHAEIPAATATLAPARQVGLAARWSDRRGSKSPIRAGRDLAYCSSSALVAEEGMS